jgi:RNA 3'-terminal phosphate cyclase
MGATGLSLEVISRGFYPRGKGSLLVTVTPMARLKPLLLETRGEMVHIQCVVVGGGRDFKSNVRKTAQLANARLVAKYGEGVRISVREAEEPDGSVACRSGAAPAVALASSADDMSKPTMKERKALQAERDRAQESTLQVQLVATTSTGGVIAADCLAETAKNPGSVEPSSVVATAMAKLEEAWTVGGGAVDEHTMDQLILFMALAAGESRILCNAPTSITSLHLETAIQLCSRLTGATFKVEPQPTPMSPDVDSCPRLVTCLGSSPSSTSRRQRGGCMAT